MVMRVWELEFALLVLLVFLGIRELVQVAPDDRGRLVAFGDGDSLEALSAVSHPDVVAHEVHEVGALQRHVRDPGVVAAVGRDVAVGARLRFLRAHGVRHEGAECLAAESFGGDRLLHVVKPVARLILGADENRACGTHRRDTVVRNRAVAAEEE